MKIFQVRWFWIYLLTVVLLSGGDLIRAGQMNVTAVRLIKGQDVSIPITAQDCSQIWLAGAVAGKHAGLPGRRPALEAALRCSPEYLSLVQALLPEDTGMAWTATRQYPDNSKAWFWLGDVTAPTDPMAARQAYLHTVALSAPHGLAWCRLGVNYEVKGELEKASEAYLNCCSYGDPGSNGCYGAGRMMERIGNPQLAIEYYRLSYWEGALKRAQELEKLINP